MRETTDIDRVGRLVERLSRDIQEHGLSNHRSSILKFLAGNGVTIDRDTGAYDANQVASLDETQRATIERYSRMMQSVVGPASYLFKDE